MKIAIIGSRGLHVNDLERYLPDTVTEIVSGGARGIDSDARAYAQAHGICCMMELDEKYASVILRRYVEDTGNAEGVYVIRGGQQIPYSDLVKEVETKEG